jgi:hypothetical protein
MRSVGGTEHPIMKKIWSQNKGWYVHLDDTSWCSRIDGGEEQRAKEKTHNLALHLVFLVSPMLSHEERCDKKT